ncbi:MAG: hypothetical protein K2Q18_18830 [Bdellovibrionales bacterium]|nr:hypothetical protein [Bdellovibrionales bacterium]
MKNLIITAVVLFSSLGLMAKEVPSSKNNVNVARVVEIVKLVNKSDIQVNVVVSDIGGSTDVSPTQLLFFNIYSKGEIFSTDASFAIGPIYSLVSAKRLSGGVYELQIVGANAETTMPEDQTLIVDAQKAIVSLKAIRCEEFDCEASTNFESTISVNLK